MAKCMHCKYFKYECRISILNKVHNEISLGHCTKADEVMGNMTLSISEACDYFDLEEVVYERGDVLANGLNVITIIGIQRDYAPNIYRVRSNYQSEWSADKEWFKEKGYKLIWRDADREVTA